MALVLDPQVAFTTVSVDVALGVGPRPLSVSDLGPVQTSGPIPALPVSTQTRSYSIRNTAGDDGQIRVDERLRVGETFVRVNTVTYTATGEVDGNPTELGPFTVVGSGTVTGTLGTPRNVILATDVNDQRYFFYPDNIPPVLGDETVTYDIKAVGYDFQAVPPAPICFSRGTLISTALGLRAIEQLQPGDLIDTKDHGLQAIRWIGSRAISAAEIEQRDNLRPIRIRAGALGSCTPSTDLVVSPQHRVLVRSKIALKMFDAMEVLVAAKQLLRLEGIDYCDKAEGVEYFHILFDKHEIVFANGAETESLFTGPEAIKSVGPAALEEIYEIFPELRDRDYSPESARLLTSGKMARKLASRHAQHGRHLV
ncbi:Hint domain-containing protein [Paracoccus nototheniae]